MPDVFVLFLVPYIACVCLISARVIYTWFAGLLKNYGELAIRLDLVEAHIKVLVDANPNIAFMSDLEPGQTVYGDYGDEPQGKGVNSAVEHLYPGMYDNGQDWAEIERIKLRAEGVNG